MTTPLPTGDKERKGIPLATGCLYYFPNALAAVAQLSKTGNDKHNPGQPLHHARSKSSDHADCILRHQAEAGTIDTDNVRHSTKVAWRALAQLQEELEREEGVPLARGARGLVERAAQSGIVLDPTSYPAPGDYVEVVIHAARAVEAARKTP